MSEPNLPSRLRAALLRVPGAGRGRRYPKRLQRQVVEYYRLRSSQGLSDTSIAAELGIPWHTLRRWHEQTPQPTTAPAHSPAFAPIQIVEPTASLVPAARGTLVVRGPAGLFVEGLDLDMVVELFRRLS